MHRKYQKKLVTDMRCCLKMWSDLERLIIIILNAAVATRISHTERQDSRQTA
jgi:hypothetical protein